MAKKTKAREGETIAAGVKVFRYSVKKMNPEVFFALLADTLIRSTIYLYL